MVTFQPPTADEIDFRDSFGLPFLMLVIYLIYSDTQQRLRPPIKGTMPVWKGPKTMKDFSEKRHTERFYLKAPIKYRTINENQDRPANMFNCSEGGLYFETGSPLKPGAEVVVSGIDNDRFSRASIKWCKRVGPADKKIYGIGAQYQK